MEEITSYERQRLINIQRNKEMLESLGLLKPFSKFPTRNKSLVKRSTKKRKRDATFNENVMPKLDGSGKNFGHKVADGVRRSLRVKEIKPESGPLSESDSSKADKDYVIKAQTSHQKRENIFGEIPGIPVGTTWATRVDCSRDGIHRPTVAGIHGSETEGCFSLALSGGYEDDIDLGESFTYTGEGGRDLKGTKAKPKNLRTAPQSKNQCLTKGNLALSRNVENRRPVRVIRGYKLPGCYAPEEGYRYDGLYTVEKFWEATGLSGFLVYKFIMSRCLNQNPIPVIKEEIVIKMETVESETESE